MWGRCIKGWFSAPLRSSYCIVWGVSARVCVFFVRCFGRCVWYIPFPVRMLRSGWKTLE